jgi:hypothetical protein
MAQPTIDIDAVVREVLAQLGLSAVQTPSPNGNGVPSVSPAQNGEAKPLPKPPAEAVAPRVMAPAKGDGQLVVTARVVTLAEVAERLSGVRQLVVPPQAIVTPAVRDELRRRNITLAFGQKTKAVNSTVGTRLVLLVARSAMDPAGLVAQLQNEEIGVEVQTSDCLMESSDRLAAELGKGNTLCVLVTTYVPAAICLANRLAGVRAVWGSDPRQVAADTAAVGANLLVVNPTGMGLFQLKQLVSRFYGEPRHECPKVFLQRLG